MESLEIELDIDQDGKGVFFLRKGRGPVGEMRIKVQSKPGQYQDVWL